MASWLIRALTLGLLAITLPLAARGLYGPRPRGVLVNVRWQPSVDVFKRQRLETEWQFVEGEEVSPSTWRYHLVAPSEVHLRTVVQHVAAADTHFIDRQRYTLAPDVRRTAKRHSLITVGGAIAVGLIDRLAMILATLAGRAPSRWRWRRRGEVVAAGVLSTQASAPLVAVAFVPAALFVLQPVLPIEPTGNDAWLFGYFPPSQRHSPTRLFLKPFALMLFGLGSAVVCPFTAVGRVEQAC